MSAMKPQRKRNVQVVVRVRPMSGPEVLDKARNIVSIDQKTKLVHVRDKMSVRPFGPFERVYDECSSQIQLYKEVVEPLISQVLQGFNATVFAYGQTGSGKTYTMEGHHDEEGNYSWEEDPTAGIIPRSLHQIFSKLEIERPEDFSVRCSYVELYNEQVFDLLSGNDQPLRVFDSKDKGVIISGLEEPPVRNRDEIYDLLRRGTDRRKTASTLMNMSSSRSHSVFTVTVTTRKTLDDEELLRIGKINLVDLAGSECVGRSGAVDARAREAGNINTSLLALGRVITALTTSSAHVPFRESKLTRILQDSLGGKQITSIIATLSPASTNFEESVNTLEYVQRAKNIKNNPEQNQMLSRKNILLAYDEEILRLQRDLAAARFGGGSGGFYVDKENYEKMATENEEARAKIDDLEHTLMEKLNEVSNLKEDLSFMDKQYVDAYEQLRERLARYEKRIHQIEDLQADMKRLEKNYASALDTLDTYDKIANRLREKEKKHKETAVILFDELALTHSKMDALRGVLSENDHLLGNFSAQRIAAIAQSKRTIDDFATEIETRVREVEKTENEVQTEVLEMQTAMNAHVLKVQREMNESVQKTQEEMKAQLLSAIDSINRNMTSAQEVINQQMEEFQQNLQKQMSKMEECGKEQRHRLESNVSTLTATMHTNLHEEQVAIERFAHQEILRETKTGMTPERRAINESKLMECTPLPSSARELLREKQAVQTPLRKSLFNIRESIMKYELPNSPNSVRQNLPSKAAPNEADETD